MSQVGKQLNMKRIAMNNIEECIKEFVKNRWYTTQKLPIAQGGYSVLVLEPCEAVAQMKRIINLFAFRLRMQKQLHNLFQPDMLCKVYIILDDNYFLGGVCSVENHIFSQPDMLG